MNTPSRQLKKEVTKIKKYENKVKTDNIIITEKQDLFKTIIKYCTIKDMINSKEE